VLKLLESQLQGTAAFGLDIFKDDLVLAPWFIHRDSSPHDHLEAVLEAEPQTTSGRFKYHRPNLGGVVLERTIEVPGPWCSQVRDFPFQPHVGKIGFKGRAD
jgi:hypothetical protein